MSITAIATRSSLRRNSASSSTSTTHSPLCSLGRHQTTHHQFHPQYVLSSISRHTICPSYTTTPSSHFGISNKRFRSTIFFSDEKGSAEENVYFKKEDEVLLKNLLSNHPEFNPKYSSASLEEEVGTLARDLHLVCKKHGVSNVSLAFLRDIQTVFEMHNWKKPSIVEGGETVTMPSGRGPSFLRSSKPTSPTSSLRP